MNLAALKDLRICGGNAVRSLAQIKRVGVGTDQPGQIARIPGEKFFISQEKC